jgi:hypothetical protein
MRVESRRQVVVANGPNGGSRAAHREAGVTVSHNSLNEMLS